MKQRIYKYINTWTSRCYKEIPEEVPIEIMRRNLAPSYKSICLAILQNDHSLHTLGFTPRESIYYGILKRIELSERNNDRNG